MADKDSKNAAPAVEPAPKLITPALAEPGETEIVLISPISFGGEHYAGGTRMLVSNSWIKANKEFDSANGATETNVFAVKGSAAYARELETSAEARKRLAREMADKLEADAKATLARAQALRGESEK